MASRKARRFIAERRGTHLVYDKLVYYVYIIKLNTGKYYAGSSADLKKRVGEHRRDAVFTTKNGKVEELVFYAAFKTEKKAVAFEKYLKSSSGFAFRNKRLI